MSYEILRVLSNWSVTSHGADAARALSSAGFSGAAVWRVEVNGRTFALRQWQKRMEVQRLQRIHDYQFRIAELGPPVIPRLEPMVSGSTIALSDRRLWELATWMPGAADFWNNPTLARLDAAMSTLAAIHNAAEFQPSLPWDIFMKKSERLGVKSERGSRSAKRRAERLKDIVSNDMRDEKANVLAEAPADQRLALLETIALINDTAPRELTKATHWRSVDLPLQRRLGDVHHDHVLFTGDEVTGVVDFGAADYDSPAGDVGRLLGTLIGDNRELWRRGLAAYTAVHPLSESELDAVDFFDSSGTVVSAANWISWLWGDAEKRLQLSDYSRPLARLARLTERLKALASRTH